MNKVKEGRERGEKTKTRERNISDILQIVLHAFHFPTCKMLSHSHKQNNSSNDHKFDRENVLKLRMS